MVFSPPLSLRWDVDARNDGGGWEIQNRKYIGSKWRLLPFIERVVCSQVGAIGSFCDLFSGTGVVAAGFRELAEQCIANDLLYSNYVTNRAFLASPEDIDSGKTEDLIGRLNALPPRAGYVSAHFTGTYFTAQNAAKIDAVREEIERLRTDQQVTAIERDVLLAALLYAVDKVANTCGQYDAYLKHLGKQNIPAAHLIDESVYKPLRLRMPRLRQGAPTTVLNQDANRLVREISVDVLYLDPPYNHRQYCDQYHLLENIAAWRKPVVRGLTRKFDRATLKSDYSRRNGRAEKALRDLVLNARCRHLFLSYNSEGLIPDEVIHDILSARGEVERFETEYSIFGNGAGRSRKRPIQERLFYCRTGA